MNAPSGLRLAILGMQGAGKGTVGRGLAELLAVPFISMGDLLRSRAAAADEIADRIRSKSEQGEFVDDQIIEPLIADRLAQPDAETGFVLDGYPRKQGQDRTLDQILARLPSPTRLDYAVYLFLPPDVALDRLSRRLLCDRCGMPASDTDVREGSLCVSGCGGAMRRRDDDLSKHVVERRHAIFESITVPLIDAYANRGMLITLDASQSRTKVVRDLAAELALDQ